MKVDLIFILEHAIVPIMSKHEKKDLVQAILGEVGRFNWGGYAFDLDLEVRQKYEIVRFDGPLPLSMAYWPSYKKGLAYMVAQYTLSPLTEFTRLKDVINEIERVDHKAYAKGKGQWCFFKEEVAVFYETFEELAEAWLDLDSIEPSPEKTKSLLKKVGLKKAADAAKEIATQEDFYFETLEDLLNLTLIK